ncbi:glycoside hydrolase superfamily [Mycena olivaceomarginata]|nr:glycoside hydrolase superfamily [Mycena olivaceomarginata]
MAAKLFQNVKYHLPSTLPDETQQDLSTPRNTRRDTRRVRTFEGWQDVDPELVAIVSVGGIPHSYELWVERSIAAKKIQQPCHYSGLRSKIFSGVIACSADVSARPITPTSEKYTTGMSYREQTLIRVLVPNWFDDSVLLGKGDLPTATYEWPDPEVLELRARPRTPTQVKRSQRSSMVYIKATEGTTFQDPTCSSKYSGATMAGLIRGGYHFAHPGSSSGTAQARYFLAHGGGWSADGRTLPGALDIEYIRLRASTYHAATTRAHSNLHHDRLVEARTGNSAKFAANNPLWIARYSSSIGTLPAGWSFTTFWQYADSGPNPGDQDLFNGDAAGPKRMATG